MASLVEPRSAPNRFAVFAAAIAGSDDTNGEPVRSAALALVRSLMTISPRRAVRLLWFFEQHGCIDRGSAIDAILDVAAQRSMCPPHFLESTLRTFLVMFSPKGHSNLVRTILLI